MRRPRLKLPDEWTDRLAREPVWGPVVATVGALGSSSLVDSTVWAAPIAPEVYGAVAGTTAVVTGIASLVLRRRGDGEPAAEAAAAPTQPALGGVRLPRSVERLLGRAGDLRRLEELAVHRRLVTVTGPGGTGKTAFAVEAAQRLAARFEATRFVDLQSLPEGSAQLADDVARTLSLAEAPDPRKLAELIGQASVLLVLDNCEHVLPAVQALVTVLLDDCPRACVLATSRSPLGVAGEQVLPLLPLEVPATDDPQEARSSSSVQLFLAEAALRAPDLVAGDAELSCVARICRRLDGLPLAIVVTAAQVGRLDLAEIERELEQCLSWATPAQVGRGDQQRTLRATVQWSYGLLSAGAQEVFSRASAFAGPFAASGAVALCAGAVPEHEVHDALRELHDHSLLVREPAGTARRYRMLEVVRRYALELLTAAPAAEQVRVHHLRYVTQLVVEASGRLTRGEREALLDVVDGVRDEVRAVLDGAAQRPGDHRLHQRLAGAMFWYWNLTGRWREARGWLEDAPSWSPEPSIDSARAVYALGALRFMQGMSDSRTTLEQAAADCRRLAGQPGVDDVERRRLLALVLTVLSITRAGADPGAAVAAAQEGVALFTELDEPWGRALALNDLGRVLSSAGRTDESDEALTESLRTWRALQDGWGIALVQTTWANSLCERGLTTAARERIAEAHAWQLRADDAWGQANSHFVLGSIAAHDDDLDQARDSFVQSVQRNLLLDRFAVAGAGLLRLADVALRLGEPKAAAQLTGGSRAFLLGTGSSLPLRERPLAERLSAALDEALGVAGRAEHDAQGERMPVVELLQLAGGLRRSAVSAAR